MEFVLTDEIKALGVSKVAIAANNIFVYNGKEFAQSRYYKNELEKTLTELQNKMISSGKFGDEKTVQKIIFLLSNAYVDTEEKKAHEKELEKQESYSQVYRTHSIIAEAILVGDTPKWLVSTAAGNISIQNAIHISDEKVLKPFERSSYVNRPYVFGTLQELDKVISETKQETFDSLYANVKKIWIKYIAEGDNHISLCSADCIFTHFQDKLGLTHYLFFVGDNDSGKSNNLHLFNFLGYRNMLSSDMTAANIYSFLGSEYEGVGTICEDEADDIDKDHEKMKIYKNGYTAGIKVYRLDIPASGVRKQEAFNTFCFKIFAAERRPDSLKAKGFNQRIVELQCTYGIPKYDISEVINPAGDDIDQKLLDELNNTRNSLLIFRLLHYHDRIPNIKVNLQNREKQLFKPLLRVFQGTETLRTLMPIVGTFVGEKRQARSHTLTAFLCSLISQLVDESGATLESSIIWERFKTELPGGEMIGKYTYNSEDFGEVSQKAFVEMLKDQFDARRPKHKGNKKQLVFDFDKLQRMKQKYNLDVDVKVINESYESLESHVGLDRHLTETDDNKESANNKENSDNNSNISREIPVNITPDPDIEYSLNDNKATQATQASSCKTSEVTLKHEIYRRNDGMLGCYRCSITGDTFDMQGSSCRRTR